jgi:hypothetical protein
VVLDIRSAWREDAFVSIAAGIDAGRPPESSTELIEAAPVRRDRLRKSAAQGAGKVRAGKVHRQESLASGETSGDQSEANRLRATGVTAGDTIAVDLPLHHLQPGEAARDPRLLHARCYPGMVDEAGDRTSDPVGVSLQSDTVASKVSPAVAQINPTAFDELKDAYRVELSSVVTRRSEEQA